MQWKPVPEYEDLYKISENGNVFSMKRMRLIKPYLNKSGYKMIALCRGMDAKHFLLHRVIAITFIENGENKPEVNHIDCDKLNNHISNLEWVTKAENREHARINGLLKQTKEQRESAGKWFQKKVAQIDNNGEVIRIFESETKACKYFGFHKGTISRYIRGKRKHKELKFKFI